MDGEDERLGKIGTQRLHAVHLCTHVNAFAERWVRSIKQECLSRLILFGEAALRRTVTEFLSHYHLERPHQGKGNQLLFSSPASPRSRHPGRIQCHERLGGLLKFYQRCIVEGATHASLVHDRRYARITTAAIRAVVTAARTGQPLSL